MFHVKHFKQILFKIVSCETKKTKKTKGANIKTSKNKISDKTKSYIEHIKPQTKIYKKIKYHRAKTQSKH